MLLRERVAHARPDRLAVAFELGESVVLGLFLDQPLRHGSDYIDCVAAAP